MRLTQEQAIRIGLELRRLVIAEGFQTAINIMKQEYQNRVFDSAPHEREVRELAYAEANALGNLLATINSFVALAESAMLHEQATDDYEE
jgi:hypothetical protein